MARAHKDKYEGNKKKLKENKFRINTVNFK
jgi:hypothetical protein